MNEKKMKKKLFKSFKKKYFSKSSDFYTFPKSPKDITYDVDEELFSSKGEFMNRLVMFAIYNWNFGNIIAHRTITHEIWELRKLVKNYENVINEREKSMKDFIFNHYGDVTREFIDDDNITRVRRFDYTFDKEIQDIKKVTDDLNHKFYELTCEMLYFSSRKDAEIQVSIELKDYCQKTYNVNIVSMVETNAKSKAGLGNWLMSKWVGPELDSCPTDELRRIRGVEIENKYSEVIRYFFDWEYKERIERWKKVVDYISKPVSANFDIRIYKEYPQYISEFGYSDEHWKDVLKNDKKWEIPRFMTWGL